MSSGQRHKYLVLGGRRGGSHRSKITSSTFEIEPDLDLTTTETMQLNPTRYTFDQSTEDENQWLETIHAILEHKRFVECPRNLSSDEWGIVLTAGAPHEHAPRRTKSMSHCPRRESGKIANEANAPARERRRDLRIRIEQYQRKWLQEFPCLTCRDDSKATALTRRNRRTKLRVGDSDPYRQPATSGPSSEHGSQLGLRSPQQSTALTIHEHHIVIVDLHS